MTGTECVAQVMRGFRMASPEGYPVDVARILEACWCQRAEERLAAKEVSQPVVRE